MTIDKRLTFKKHTYNRAGKAWAAYRQLFPLTKHLDKKENAKLYKIYIRPRLEYGLTALQHLPVTNYKKCIMTQNSIVRQLGKYHWTKRNTDIREEMNIISFEDRIQTLQTNFMEKTPTTD